MRNKKLVVLIVLSVGAVLSLIYGVTAPEGRRKPLPAPEAVSQPEISPSAKFPSAAGRTAAKTRFVSWKRNPFVTANAPAKELPKLILNGIAWDAENPRAIINDDVVKIGDIIDGNTIIDIQQDRVILNDGTVDFEIRLRED